MIEKYSFNREIDGQLYSVEFSATDFKDAEKVCEMLKGQDLGKIVSQEPICSDCLNQLICLECEDLKEGFLPPVIPTYCN